MAYYTEKTVLVGVNKLPRLDLENPRPTLHQRLQISTYGYIEIGNVMKPGWKKPIPHYLFLCPKHGYVIDYLHGHRKNLSCPKCREEKTK